jgi:hypothetical protein
VVKLHDPVAGGLAESSLGSIDRPERVENFAEGDPVGDDVRLAFAPLDGGDSCPMDSGVLPHVE